jgi:hypothetical protein
LGKLYYTETKGEVKMTKDWNARGDFKNHTIVIIKEGIEVACIMEEQVIHGLEVCQGEELIKELVLAYQDILEDLGLEFNELYAKYWGDN